ncbi:hypothetical protein HYS54_03120 [Candidatus Micrarchaeota archaeon]|nr:hypothetical protein [Candidatus Micrarchaeota archaeon]
MKPRDAIQKLIQKLRSALVFWKRKKPQKKPTLKEEIRGWIIDIAIVFVVYFIILPAILGTSTPMVVVASCSERGYLNIGDVLVLQGINIRDVRAPLVELTEEQFRRGFEPHVDENGEARWLHFSDVEVELNRSSDVIVYISRPYRAQIIHRVFAKLKVGEKYYLVTKGDANQLPDQFGGNGACLEDGMGCLSSLVTQEMIVGKQAFFAIPVVGHVKLFFCDVTRVCDGHSNAGTGNQFKLWC